MYTNETLERAKAYEKSPIRSYPSALEALSSIHVAYMVDLDILKNIKFEFYYDKDRFPHFKVYFSLKEDVLSELITLQHQQIF